MFYSYPSSRMFCRFENYICIVHRMKLLFHINHLSEKTVSLVCDKLALLEENMRKDSIKIIARYPEQPGFITRYYSSELHTNSLFITVYTRKRRILSLLRYRVKLSSFLFIFLQLNTAITNSSWIWPLLSNWIHMTNLDMPPPYQFRAQITVAL